jgi:uncharacterized protein YpuA (DUF1002 family)
MPLRKEYQERLSKEYRYAATKMQEVSELDKKLFYFSVLFSEAQRTLNWQWDRDLVLIYTVTQFAHTQINNAMQAFKITQALPIDWATIFNKLTSVASDMATYFEKAESNDNGELIQILGHLSEITYAVLGNGSYLYEKGLIKL